VVFVLHVFQKKSTQGIKTNQGDIDLIKKRLHDAGLILRTAPAEEKHMSKIQVHEGSGNVFEDLGFEHPEEAQFKSGLVALIGRHIRARKLTQARAGKILGVGQPKVSDMLRGHFHGYSVERLFGFLLKLGNDVEITVHERHRRGRVGHLRLSA